MIKDIDDRIEDIDRQIKELDQLLMVMKWICGIVITSLIVLCIVFY